MWKVLMPRKIAFGENAAKEFQYPKNSLVVTTTTPDIYNKWLDYMGIKNYEVYDKVTPDPSIEAVEALKKQYDGNCRQNPLLVCFIDTFCNMRHIHCSDYAV